MVRARVQGDGGFGERVDVDRGDLSGRGPRRDDRHETAPGREVQHPPPGDFLRMLPKPSRQRKTASPRERPERDRRTIYAKRLLDGVPHGLDGICEVESNAGHPVHILQTGVPLDEPAPVGKR